MRPFPFEQRAVLHAAVVIPIVRHDVPTLVVVRRAAHLRRNPGQIGFPGGIIDGSDLHAEAAARREFEEELGVSHERVRIVGRLKDVVTLALSVTIAPFVGLIDPPVQYRIDPAETQSVHEIPLHAVYAAGALYEGSEEVVVDGRSYVVRSWLFDYDGIHIWGATARIMYDFMRRYPSLTAIPNGVAGVAHCESE